MSELTQEQKLRLEMYEAEVMRGVEPLREAIALLVPVSKKFEESLPALLALKSIKEEQLYKSFKNWPNYCKYWQIDLDMRELDRMLEWAGTVDRMRRVKDLAEIPNESQARALRDLPEEEAVKAWEEVQGTGKTTAKRLKEAAQKRTLDRLESMSPAEQKTSIEANHAQAQEEYQRSLFQEEAEEAIEELEHLADKATHPVIKAFWKENAQRLCTLAGWGFPHWTNQT